MKPEEQRREIKEGIEMGMLELYMNYGTFQIVIAKLGQDYCAGFVPRVGVATRFCY
jgi:hypothetical protein